VTSFPAVKGKDLIAALRGQGFTVIRIKGSHHFIRHTDGRATVVPVHAGETLMRIGNRPLEFSLNISTVRPGVPRSVSKTLIK
jgi:predicted RNA binding protein YcfA (HicA-like mRNA interferase family)